MSLAQKNTDIRGVRNSFTNDRVDNNGVRRLLHIGKQAFT